MTTYDMVEPPDLMYGVLLNDVDDDALERSDSFGGWTLKRAPLDAMVSLRVEFKKYSSEFEPDFPGSHECQIVPSGQGFHFSPIADCARWRYGVLIPGEGRLLNGAKLSEALRISDSDLHVDLWQLNPRDWNSGLGGSPAHNGSSTLQTVEHARGNQREPCAGDRRSEVNA